MHLKYYAVHGQHNISLQCVTVDLLLCAFCKEDISSSSGNTLEEISAQTSCI